MSRGFSSRHLRLRSLASGVHAAIATPGGFGLCNAGIVDLGDETVVFDTMLTPAAGGDLARAAERCTGRRPAWVVNSHWHGDHIWGNSAFPESHVVSSRTVRENILRRSRGQFVSDRHAFRRELPLLDSPDSPYRARDRAVLRGWFSGLVGVAPTHRIVPPDVTFVEELVLEGSRRSLHLVTYGGGHSPSDVFAYLPDEAILFAGDLAMRGLHPSVGDGRPAVWSSILKRMEKLRIETVVPGHGPPGPRGTLPATRHYLDDLVRIAAEARRSGAGLRELRRQAVPDRYRRWGFAFMFPDNLARAYRLTKAPPPRRRR